MNHIEFAQAGLHNRHIVFLLNGVIKSGVVVDDPSHTEGKTKDSHYTFIPTENLKRWRNAQANGDRTEMYKLSSVVDIEEITWGMPNDSGSRHNLFHESELINYLANLLRTKKDTFRNVRVESQLNNSQYRADITAERKNGSNWKPIIIEVKSFTSFTSKNLRSAINQLEEYGKLIPGNMLALTFPGVLPSEDEELLNYHNIEVWDVNYISNLFRKEINETPHPILQALFSQPSNGIPQQNKWIAELESIKTGDPKTNEWLHYQTFIQRVLEYIFGDQLSSPITQHSDYFGINRPDFILRNYAEVGFWSQLRSRYHADFIVADAKNYTKPIKKDQVIQIANYLKVHGPGLFGMIFTRKGSHENAYHTCREIWAMDKKMIVIFDDEDLKKMILAFETTQNPEEIIRQKIEHFRLSM